MLSRAAVLWDPDPDLFHRTWRPALDDAARHLGLVVTEPYIVSKPEDFEPIFANIRQDRPDGLLALPRASFFRTVTAASRPVNAHAAAENVSRVPV